MRLVLLTLLAAALVLPAAAPAATPQSIALKVGEGVDVVGTRIGCFAVTSGGKKGMQCVLFGSKGPLAGSYGVGLAVDGTAVLVQMKADGSAQTIARRKPQALGAAAAKVYKVTVGDLFGFQITKTIALGCKVVDVRDTTVEPFLRGVKVACWRATSSSPLPKSYGVSISDRVAGVFVFDAKGRVTPATATKDILRQQPA